MSDWEARMAAKAAVRKQARLAHEESLRLAENAEWHRQHDTTVEEYVCKLAEELRGEGLNRNTVLPPYACACMGKPPELPDGAPCRCTLFGMAFNKL